MEEARTAARYSTYWIAWLALLGLTLMMLLAGSRPLIVAGIAAKSAIIALWFMHLRYERVVLALTIAIAILATALILFGLISVDARAW